MIRNFDVTGSRKDLRLRPARDAARHSKSTPANLPELLVRWCNSKAIACHTILRDWVCFAGALGIVLAFVNPARSEEPPPTSLRDVSATQWAQQIVLADAQIKLHPDDPALYLSRGRLKLRVRQFGEAIADFTRAIELKPDRWAYAIRSGARFLAGDSAGAAEDRKKEAAFQSPGYTRPYQLMLKEVSELRRLPILRPVPVLYRSSQDAELLDALWNPASAFHEEDLTYKRLGIVPKEFSMSQVEVARVDYAIYDSNAHVVFERERTMRDSDLAHELTHALQDQNGSFDAIVADNSDAQLAFKTLIESDACDFESYWEDFYHGGDTNSQFHDAPSHRDDPTRGQVGPLLPEPTAPRRIAPTFSTFLKGITLERWIKTAIDWSASSRAAEAFADLSVAKRNRSFDYDFPLSSPEETHTFGQPFIEELRKRGGWERVNAAYRDLPKSSAQILHPEKYFAGEEPVEITIPDISSRLGRHWRRINSDTIGEYSYAHIFTLTLPESEAGRNAVAAAGWRGDRYSIYEGPLPGDVCMMQVSVWDTEQDAREFFEQYERYILRRYPSAKAVPKSTGARVWKTNEGGVFLGRQGRAVLIAEGVPESALKPDHADVHFRRGFAFEGKGHVDDAIAEYRKAITSDPDYAEPHYGLGIALQGKGQLDEAIAEYRKVITLKPDAAEAHNNLGAALAGQGHLDEAIAEYRKVITLKPDDARAHNNLGLAFESKGLLDEAIAEYRQAIASNPHYADALSSLRAALEKKDQAQ